MTDELGHFAVDLVHVTNERDILHDALVSLANEVSAILGLSEAAIRESAGNTNLACLKRRLAEARDIIEETAC